MQEVKLTINGQEVIVEEGTTVLEAAKRIGIKIPTLCTMPELGFTPGSCRVCVVEVEDLKYLIKNLERSVLIHKKKHLSLFLLMILGFPNHCLCPSLKQF
ncbi:unnamed protein product [marine sediment metagenome]|uniref:2Fe-2S ferredoxin-type domain-containing protein n=1 Tax=marine sediment metagenome TaxID=412755 RepID=X1LKD9_9ZZZZ